MNELFPPEFVAALSRLRLHAGQVPRGGRHAEQGSAQLGAGMEFRDYRSYQPGDDIRRIDWNFYQRSGRLFLRLFEEERDLPVYVLLDCSDSMFIEDPPRANAASILLYSPAYLRRRGRRYTYNNARGRRAPREHTSCTWTRRRPARPSRART